MALPLGLLCCLISGTGRFPGMLNCTLSFPRQRQAPAVRVKRNLDPLSLAALCSAGSGGRGRVAAAYPGGPVVVANPSLSPL